MTGARSRIRPSAAGDLVAYHVVFHLVGQRETSGVPARLQAFGQALRDCGQRVSIVDDATSVAGPAGRPESEADRREIPCDVLVVVPVGPARGSRAPIGARWRMLWIDRADLLRDYDPADFDYVCVTWAHLRRSVRALWGLASDRVLTTGLGVSGRRAVAPSTTSGRDPHRVALLAGSEPALPLAAEILQGLREHDSRFGVEILGAPEGGGVAETVATHAGLSVRSGRDDEALDAALAMTSVLVVTRSAAEDQSDFVIRARHAGAIVVAADGPTASELVLPEYDGVLLEDAPESPAFVKACVAQVLRLRDDGELSRRLRARAMTEPLSWAAIARQWVAHWGRLAAPERRSPPPCVSVVMAVCDDARDVEEAVDSILGQTVWDLELIVVNDGSTDGTGEILHRYRDRRLRIVDQENTGLWAALNRGLREVRGMLVARMDGDDVAHPRRLQYQLDFLEAHPRVALLGTACYKVEASGRIFMLHAVPTDDHEIKRWLPQGNPFIHPSVLMRRSALDRVGPYRRHEAEDYDLFLRISERFDVANLDQPLHRLRRTGMTRVARFEQEIVDSVRRCAEQARRRCTEGRDREGHPALRRRPILGLPLADLRWRERRPYARTLHALGEGLATTDRAMALTLLARAIVLAPEISQHWRSWLRVWLARDRPPPG